MSNPILDYLAQTVERDKKIIKEAGRAQFKVNSLEREILSWMKDKNVTMTAADVDSCLPMRVNGKLLIETLTRLSWRSLISESYMPVGDTKGVYRTVYHIRPYGEVALRMPSDDES